MIDALIGYGLRAAPRGRLADMIAWADGSGAPILSLDIPSGVDATTGATPGVVIHPETTLTLALPKTGLAGFGVGELWLADLGIPIGVYNRVGLSYMDPFGDQHQVRLRAHSGPDSPNAHAEAPDKSGSWGAQTGLCP